MPIKTQSIRRNQVLRRARLTPAQQLDAVLSRARGHAGCEDWGIYLSSAKECSRYNRHLGRFSGR